jgi:hypothetical protein
MRMRFIFNLVLGVLLALGILEGLFSVLPVNSGLRMVSTSAAEPYSRYLPRQPFVYSHGWDLMNARHGMTNNLGFINAADFVQPPYKVLIMGDSFIESFMHNYADTLQGRLASALGSGVETVATSGNSLADSLELLKKFAPKMQPTSVVIFVKTSDPSDLSEIAAAPLPGHNGFVNDGQSVGVQHLLYTESSYKKWVMKSALIRYVYYNLKFSEWLSRALQFGKPVGRASDKSTVLDKAVQKQRFMRYYLSELSKLKQVHGLHITFLLDADRNALYPSVKNKTQALNLKDQADFSRFAVDAGFELLNMKPIFERHWSAYRQQFDYLPADGHWNTVAHKLAAEALLPVLLRVVSGDLSVGPK